MGFAVGGIPAVQGLFVRMLYPVAAHRSIFQMIQEITGDTGARVLFFRLKNDQRGLNYQPPLVCDQQ